MYTSESLAGDPIVVTGVVAVPEAPAPEGGRTTLALAHGTAGIADVHLLADRPFDIDIHVIPAARGEPEHLHFDVRFLVSTARPDIATLSPEESIDLAWLDFDEAERRMNAPESSRALAKIREIVRRGA